MCFNIDKVNNKSVNIMFKSISNTYAMQYLINKVRSIYYPILYNTFEADPIAPTIIKGLWLGALESACDYEGLKARGITHIVTAVWDIDPIFPDDDSIKYFKVPLIDRNDQPISNYFNVVVDFIDEALLKGEGVLVHCICGVSRSPTLICAYLMRVHHLDASTAIKYVKQSRPKAQPNLGFVMQLLDAYE